MLFFNNSILKGFLKSGLLLFSFMQTFTPWHALPRSALSRSASAVSLAALRDLEDRQQPLTQASAGNKATQEAAPGNATALWPMG